MSQVPQEFTDQIGGWKFKRITPNCNHYIAYPQSEGFANNAIPMTGNDVESQIRIPYPHRINKIVFCHLDANNALNTDALNVDFGVKQGQQDSSPLFTDALLTLTAITDSKRMEVFGEAYEFESRTWTLTLNTTNGHKIVPILYIQLVGTGGYTT